MPFCDPFRQNLKKHIALDHLADFSPTSPHDWFLGIGKVSPWISVTGSNGDNYPPQAVDSDEEETLFWRNLLAAKRISENDVCLVIPRYDWAAGDVYTPYRNNSDLFDDANPAKFYVLVDEERVYKCIDNNYGAASTIPPTHTDSQIRKLTDGYRWKFLYRISEQKRKFLTKTYITEGTSVGTLIKQGYMPVDYVDFLRLNDDRTLQFSVQQAAVDGEIAFTEFKEEYLGFVASDNTCLLPSTEHVGISITGSTAGLTADLFIGYSPFLIGANDIYNGRILSIDTGDLIGSRRTIVDYSYNETNSQGSFKISPAFSSNTVLASTNFSILPSIVIDGDGIAGSSPPNPGLGYADITVKFGNDVTGASGCDVYLSPRKFVTSFEMVDTGKRYTFANIESIGGLTFVGGISGNIRDIALPVISPPGGHGANAPRELGAASIMIVKDFYSDEDGEVSVENEFRQFGIIKDPELYTPIVRMYLERGGFSGSFDDGGTATQGFTGMFGGTGYSLAQGRIVDWLEGWQVAGLTAYGSSELRVTGITGEFQYGGVVRSTVGATFGIVGLDEIKRAGREARYITQLEVVSDNPSALSGDEFERGQYVQGMGNFTDGVSPSHATGRVYSYSLISGSTTRGYLKLESVGGSFTISERVIACDYNFRPLYSLTSANAVKISAITTETLGSTDVYKTTTRISLNAGASGGLFTTSTYNEDDVVSFVLGDQSAYGTVVEWIVGTAATANADMLLSGVNGTFVLGMTSSYQYQNATYVATVTGIDHTPDLKYRSGEVSYIQNIRPVQRSDEQREEIKIVINF